MFIIHAAPVSAAFSEMTGNVPKSLDMSSLWNKLCAHLQRRASHCNSSCSPLLFASPTSFPNFTLPQFMAGSWSINHRPGRQRQTPCCSTDPPVPSSVRQFLTSTLVACDVDQAEGLAKPTDALSQLAWHLLSIPLATHATRLQTSAEFNCRPPGNIQQRLMSCGVSFAKSAPVP
ncbi:hypothetical protein VFPPC_00761 [Pochonia chlamydosporia 170]|uniref:Uncharacterized protein n=1 Tax=Pochonia chlamydosporia 170 TaxID=1380566 RepID=A0A179G5X1_METCM|nr:hypothetical protein VFPPC_00761 [Pochonia chlamydosporia 170]OAQ72920.1 hypothetical protein VFPPC_00761 [Pochonia chlamydosporia 170]